MISEDTEKFMRVLILGTLVEHSGKNLQAELIGQLSTEILERIKEVLARDAKR